MFYLYLVFVICNIIYGIIVSAKNTSINVTINRVKIFNLDDAIGLALLIDLIFIAALPNSNIADFDTYKLLYNSGSTTLEAGYLLLSNLGRKVGFSYETFRGVIFCICFTLVWAGIKRLKVNENLVLGLYSICPYTLDVIQNRYFLATSILIFSISYLNSSKKGDSIKFIIGIFVASLIHRVAIVFLVLILAQKGRNEKIRRNLLYVLVFISFMLSVFMKILPEITQTVINFLLSINSERTLAYTKVLPQWGFLLFWVGELLYAILSFIIRNGYILSKKYSKYELISETEERLSDLIFWVNMSACCLLPLLIININFYRIFRSLSLINYLQLILLLRNKNVEKNFMEVLIFIGAFIFNIYLNIGLDPQYYFFTIFGK